MRVLDAVWLFGIVGLLMVAVPLVIAARSALDAPCRDRVPGGIFGTCDTDQNLVECPAGFMCRCKGDGK